MKKIIMSLIFFLSFSLYAIVGNEYLLINDEGKSRSLGGAGVSENSFFCNPAFQTENVLLKSSYLLFFEDLRLGKVLLAYPLKKITLTGFYRSLYMPLTEKIINGISTGQYLVYKDFDYGFGIGIPFLKNHVVGVTIKQIRRVFVSQIRNFLAFDVGYKYSSVIKTSWFANMPVSAGISCKNFGVSFDKNLSESLPLDLRAGISSTLNISFESGMDISLVPILDVEKVLEENWNYHWGTQIDLKKWGQINFGIFNNGQWHFTFGANEKIALQNFDLLFSYAVEPLNFSNPQHSISLDIYFHPAEKIVQVENRVIVTNQITNVVMKTKIMKKEIIRTNKDFFNIQKIIVKPFKNIGANSRLAYLSQTIAESISTSLGENSTLQILQTIDSNVHYCLVTGSYVEIDNNIQLNVNVIDSSNSVILLSKQYNSEMGKNIFFVLDTISKEISEILEEYSDKKNK